MVLLETTPAAAHAREPLTPQRLYDIYGVSPYMRRHMLRAAAIAELVADDWTGPSLDRRRLRRCLLVHDIGGVAAGERSIEGAPTPATADVRRRSEGDTRRGFTIIADDIGLTPAEQMLVRERSIANAVRNLASGDYTLMLAGYADNRQQGDNVFPLREALERGSGPRRSHPTSTISPKCRRRSKRSLSSRQDWRSGAGGRYPASRTKQWHRGWSGYGSRNSSRVGF